VLELILRKVKNSDMIDVPSIETADRNAEKLTFKHELHEFTPLQLAIASPYSSLQVVKMLMANDSNQRVKVKGTQDNLLHLCAKYFSNNDVLKYLVENSKLDIFERNAAGETVLTICQQKGNTEGIKLIEKVQELFDKSGKNTEDLLAELEGDEEKNEKARQKKKEKKYRNKLSKLALQHNCSVEEVVEVLRQQEEDKKR